MKKNKRSVSRRIQKRRLTNIIFFTLLLLTLPAIVFAGKQQQMFQLKGRVIDTKGVPMVGVTVRVEETTIGVATDKEGTFSLSLPIAEGNLLISFIGYKTKQVHFKGNATLKIVLEEERTTLDAVQVVAYGEQRVREAVGSVVSLKAEALKDGSGGDLVGKLQGKLAGVSIMNASGAPGYQGSITVRGHNSLAVEAGRVGSDPLWVVDGIPINNTPDIYTGQSPLATIPSSEIERIDILKDAASCAMYGSRAANGVVLITTKSGRMNEKFQVTVNYTQSFSFRSDLPAITIGNAERRFRIEALRNYTETIEDYETNSQHYIGSAEEAEDTGMQKDYFWNVGQGATVAYLQDSLNSFYNNANAWYKYLFQVRKVSDVSIGLSGGSDKMASYIGVGYYHERGALIQTGFTRATLTGNFTFTPFPRVRGRLGISLTRTTTERPNKNSASYHWKNVATIIPEIPDMFMNISTLALKKGTPAFDYFINQYKYMKEENDAYRFRTNLSVGYEFIDGLEVRTNFSFDYLGSHRNTFLPKEINAYSRTYSSGEEKRNLSGLNENILSFDHRFGKGHRIKAIAGISFQMDQFNGISGYGYGDNNKVHFVSWSGNERDTETGDQLKEFNTDKTKSGLISLFARVGYNYKDKYIIEASIRRDGSSRFGRNNRWGTFPSLALGYAFTEEPFMEAIRHIIPYGKLRFSWGRTGKQFEDEFFALGLYGPSGKTFQGKPAMHTTTLPNPDLTWEKTDQYDIGLDTRLLNQRVGLTIDYYYRYTHDMLYPISLSGDYANVEQWQNAFAISNQGIEVALQGDIIHSNNIRVNLSFNISRNWNRLEKSQENRSFIGFYSTQNINIIGKELNRIYVLDDSEGFYQRQDEVPVYYFSDQKHYLGGYNQYYRQGDRKIKDVSGDGIINEDDLIDAGSPLPKAYGGIGLEVEYKGFDLSVNMPFSIGRHILYSGVIESLATIAGSQTPILSDLSQYTFYTEGAGNYNMPRNEMSGGLSNYSGALLSNVYRVSFIKLGLISLGYTFPRKSIWFADVRVFLSGENLFKISKFPGHDPELGNPINGMYNMAAYPLSRTVNFGLTVKF